MIELLKGAFYAKLNQRRVKNICWCNAGCKKRDGSEICLPGNVGKHVFLLKIKRVTVIHDLVDEPEHIALFGLPFFLFFECREPLGQVAFAIAMHLRAVAVFAKVGNDVISSQLEIQVQKGNHPYLDQHEAQQAEGYSLFCKISHKSKTT